MKKILSMLMSLLVILSTFSILALKIEVKANQGTWVQKAPMPTPRRDPAAVTLNGKIYILGGIAISGGNFIWCSIVEIYDPQTDTWTTGTAMPDSKGGSGHAAGIGAAVINNKIYVVGGDNRTFCYDPGYDQWDDTLAEIPVNGYIGSAFGLAVVDGKMYVAKGSYYHPSGEYWTYSYDPSTDIWTELSPIPYPHAFQSLAEVGGKLYAIGGVDPNEGARAETNRVSIYNPETDSWEYDATPRMSYHRTDLEPTTPVIDGNIYVMGGWNGYRALSEVEVYNSSTNTWTTLASMPTARWSLATAVFNDKIYAVGGNQYRYNLQSANEEFTPPGWTSSQVLYGLAGPQTDKRLISIDPNTASTTVVGEVGSGLDLEGLAYNSDDGFLYGSTGWKCNDGLIRIDPSTGIGQSVGPYGIRDLEVDSLAFHPLTGVLYGIDEGDSPDGGGLFIINAHTGTATFIGYLGAPYGVGEVGMAFNSTGTLFGVDTASDQLFTINTATGEATSVGALGFENVNGLDFHPNTGVLFGIDGQSKELITIDTSSGQGTLVGVLTGPVTESPVALAFKSVRETPPITWEYIFEDSCRNTELRISTDDKQFQFITPDNEYPVKHDPDMRICQRRCSTSIKICYEDSEIKLSATAIDDKVDFCIAYAKDKHTCRKYLLIDGWRRQCSDMRIRIGRRRCFTSIRIYYKNNDIKLSAKAKFSRFNFYKVCAKDRHTGKRYLLIDKWKRQRTCFSNKNKP